MSEAPYWLRLDFPEAAVQIVRDALKSKLYRGSELERLEKLRALNVRLSSHYEVPASDIFIRDSPMGPHYLPGRNRIVLDRSSLVSYLHEFGHHVLHVRGVAQNETYPRAFSLGLFYTAAPQMFTRALEAGRLHFTGEADEITGGT